MTFVHTSRMMVFVQVNMCVSAVQGGHSDVGCLPLSIKKKITYDVAFVFS